MGELDEYPPDKRPELLEWLVSVVHFDAGQTRRIHIRYDSLYAYCSGGYSDDGDTCDDRFAYVLSTASVWKGPIASGKITIDAVTVPAEQIIFPRRGAFTGMDRVLFGNFAISNPQMPTISWSI
jgi:hypothetical protein